jgi:hypothetical protein
MEVRGHLHIAAARPWAVRLTSHRHNAEFDSERCPACLQDAVRTTLQFLLFAAVAAMSARRKRRNLIVAVTFV